MIYLIIFFYMDENAQIIWKALYDLIEVFKEIELNNK